MERTVDLTRPDHGPALESSELPTTLTGDPTPAAEWRLGPLYGLYSACYVVRNGDRYVGYAKVCTGWPWSAWSTRTCVARIGSRPYPSVQQAIDGLNRKVERTLAIRRKGLFDRILSAFRPQLRP